MEANLDIGLYNLRSQEIWFLLWTLILQEKYD